MDDLNEIWRECPSYPGIKASSFGRVMYPSGRIANTGLTEYGYRRAHWSVAGVHKIALQHSLVADAFLGPRPIGYHIDHIDGVRTNNSISNLRYLTPLDNVLASVAAGRSTKGETHSSAVLTEDQAISILREYNPIPRAERRPHISGRGALKTLAKKYGVSHKTVQGLVYGRTWRHLASEREAMRNRIAQESTAARTAALSEIVNERSAA